MSQLRRFARTTFAHSYSLQATQFVFTSAWVFLVGAESFAYGVTLIAWAGAVAAAFDAGLVAVVVTPKALQPKEVASIARQQVALAGLATVLLIVLLSSIEIPGLASWSWSVGLILPVVLLLLSLARLRLQLLFRNLEAGALGRIRWVGLLSRYGSALTFGLFGEWLFALLVGVGVGIIVEHSYALFVKSKAGLIPITFTGGNLGHRVANRWHSTGEEYLAELRRHLDVLILGGVLDPILLGAYVYLSKVVLQARDLVLSPLSGVLLATYTKQRAGERIDGPTYLATTRTLTNLIAPGVLLVAGMVFLIQASTPEGQGLPEWFLGVALVPALSVPLYPTGALLYAHGQYARMALYNLVFTGLLALAYASIHITTPIWMLCLVASCSWLSLLLFYPLMLKRLSLFSGPAFYQSVWTASVGGLILLVLHLYWPWLGVLFSATWLMYGIITDGSFAWRYILKTLRG